MVNVLGCALKLHKTRRTFREEMMKKLLLLALIGSLALAGCSAKDKSSDSAATETATVSVPSVDAATFQSKIIERGVVVLDVRTADEFKQNHIIDARNIDVESADFDSQISKLDKKVTYALYCQSGRRSAIAYTKMKEAGFINLYNLDGGMNAWVAAGLPRVGN
jgi:phage shock protein E